MELEKINQLCRLIRYYILIMTTVAGSGHPTSSLSAVELMTVLFFKYFHFDLDNPDNPNNDRLLLSKGHATPLFYSLYAAAGKLNEAELLKYRKFDSNLQGHPMPDFPFTEVPTGSLGQGLSVGVGEALALRARISNFKFQISNFPRVYVLLGDGEMAEGSVWEAIQYAGFQKLDNLIAILDVNRLGQSDETMVGFDIETYKNRVKSFGWEVITVTDGHNLEEISAALRRAAFAQGKPVMIVAKTIKGKGFSLWEDKNGWHSKPLNQEQLQLALNELGAVDKVVRGVVQKSPGLSLRGVPSERDDAAISSGIASPRPGEARNDTRGFTRFKKEDKVATKKAFGSAIERLGILYPNMIVLDGDVKNSLHTDQFAKSFPGQFLQMYIAEQNMVGVASGLARRSFIPFVTTFACFMTRAHDQIRMAALGGLTILFNGSYAGTSLGKDGPSQMGLDDIGLFRSLLDSTVVYPADAFATEKLVEIMLGLKGVVYIRTTREPTPILYSESEQFVIGGSKTFKRMDKGTEGKDLLTIVAAGITVHEALKAQKILAEKNIPVQVIDCYSIKPVDKTTLQKAAAESRAIITVEDHYVQGGLGDAVLEALAVVPHPPVFKLAVTKLPRSGKPEELLDFEGISATKIVDKIEQIINAAQ